MQRLCAALVFVCACGGSSPSPDGGPARVLEIVSDGGQAMAQVGLNYNAVTVLAVRYHLDDAAHTPLAGQEVRFAIFDDPKGSTLSSDRAFTDGSGLASISLTAGTEESSFRVEASATGAFVDYGVTTSKLGFIDLDVSLAWQSTGSLMTLRGLLYLDTSCAQLPLPPTVMPALRELGEPGPTATLGFRFLLSGRDYAVLGRAEDTAGHLLAQACVDLGPVQLPVGVTSTVTVPLAAVSARLDGTYALTTSLAWSAAERTRRTAPYDRFSLCPLGPGEALLDVIVAVPSLPAAIATAITAHRGAVDAKGCHAATVGAASSVDDLVMAALGPLGAELPAVAGEVDQLFLSADLASTLAVEGVGTQSGRHRLTTLTLSTASPSTTSTTTTIDLESLGLPVIEAWPVSLTLDGSSLAIGTHGFTLALPASLETAFSKLSLAPRLPSVMDPLPHDLASHVIAAATSGAKSGCAAVEAVICAATTAPGCTGPVATACAAATTTWGADLDATFDSPGGLDLVWSGQAMSVDTDGDLIIDTLKPATWVTSFDAPSPFSATREP